MGLSQTQAAEQLGIAQSYYSMLEKGARQPSKAIRQRLQEWMRDLETR
ncbi:helix-turn-helix transcriptional regulator (plasmid) [Paludibaculum fermentans]|uniref:Helix-turn-helix transcriptional regulator n=1 Tax=Paludibaculum fermentans TaxID=1473598 RepID=A0A7S7SNF3_PALFE|nr:helix-turn-helix transcriptional regulator [Paludibaculum fermentans]